MKAYATVDTPLWGKFQDEIKVVNSKTWICMQQACDGVHHYYQLLENIT